MLKHWMRIVVAM